MPDAAQDGGCRTRRDEDGRVQTQICVRSQGPCDARVVMRQRRRRVQQVQKKWPQAQTGDRTQQPAQVVARGTADRLHRIAQRALQSAAVYPVIGLEVSDRRLDGLAPTQPALLLRTQALELASVDDLLVGVVSVHAAQAKIGDDLPDCDAQVLR